MTKKFTKPLQFVSALVLILMLGNCRLLGGGINPICVFGAERVKDGITERMCVNWDEPFFAERNMLRLE